MDLKLYGAIDIGTNAGRLLIGYIVESAGFLRTRQVEMVRVPLRLGKDVFETGSISKHKQDQLSDSLMSFKLLMDVYGVKKYRAYATSALREAKNSSEIIKTVFKHTGIHIEAIDGQKEADLIMSTFYTQPMPYMPYLFIDIGGGSTELSFIFKGVKQKSRSFPIGTVRELMGRNDPQIWREIEQWICEHKIPGVPMAAVGTGGNINRVAKILQKLYLQTISLDEINGVLDNLRSMSYEERVMDLLLKPDRADVIIPALEIFTSIMRSAKIDFTYVPRMGLADGMLLELYNDDIEK
jgi:exopolyphosphatase / guanosine-5'-triphosphate,3'-diphosphate pyrophosphatase